MTPYADTNFFTRVYLPMPGSADADRLLLAASRNSATSGQPFISAQQATLAHANFRGDAERSNFLRPVVIRMADLERQFEELSLRRTARHGFRTYDLLHVASAILLGCDTFWSFDTKATNLAKLEGLKIR